jgi:tRNA-binding protein
MSALDAFAMVDVRVGTVTSVEPHLEARKPAYRLTIDFGPEIGVKRSSAQIVALYDSAALLGRQVVAVVNFPPKRIAGFVSEVLVLGVPTANGNVVLLRPDRDVGDGVRVF